MNRTWMGIIGLCFALAFAGCGDKSSNPSNNPQVDPGDGTTDETPPDSNDGTNDKNPDDGQNPDSGNHDGDRNTASNGTGKLADLCGRNDDCASGLCVSLGQGINDSLCSQRCNKAVDCGDESTWDCVQVAASVGDTISVCVPKNLCLDIDGDGYGVGPGCLGADCDDDDISVYFGAPELCDGKDNDCNGVIDDNTTIEGSQCDTKLPGVCARGQARCDNGNVACHHLIEPGQNQEICDGLDNDCDGLTDEGPNADQNANYIKGVGFPCSLEGNDATCPDGIYLCDPTQGIICQSHEVSKDDTCNGVDDDCNGSIDDDVDGLNIPCTSGKGECIAHGITICDADPYAAPVCNAKPDTDAAGDEVCDYKDNNCNGQIDEGYVDANGTYFQPTHCGSCDVDCSQFWVNNAYAETINPTCNVQGSNAACSYSCQDGYVDLDGDKSNGCEYKLNERSVYVAPANKGGVHGGACTYESPCDNIQSAINAITRYNDAGAHYTEVLVGEGIYREGVTLKSGISIKGGYNAINWTRNINENRTMIIGSVKSTGDRYTVLADGITKTTELSGFTIISQDAQAGQNSIGLLIRNSTDKLTIKDNVIQAGIGGAGVSGTSGSDGQSGANGQAGNRGYNIIGTCTNSNEMAGGKPGITSCGGNSDVSGGAGAPSECPGYGQAGGVAKAGNGANPGAGGNTAYGRGWYQNACYPRPDLVDKSFQTNGEAGDSGANGDGGAGASDDNGALDASGMWRADGGKSGKQGKNGSGGGGGGASHGTMICDAVGTDDVFKNCNTTGMIGSSGGGGGAGGCGGSGATGGGGGGGSFAIYAYYDTPSSLPIIKDNVLERNLGGQGGDGGIGGGGGDGGLGGLGGAAAPQLTYCPQAGRSGGAGGDGGEGGGGGGGAGGVSYDIAVFGANVDAATLRNQNTFSIDKSTDTAGKGGPGGGSMGTSGKPGVDGVFGQIYNP